MKKLVLLAIIAVFAINTNAQSKAISKATAAAEYVATEMKLDADKSAFLKTTLVEKATKLAEKIKSTPDITKEQKKEIAKKCKKHTAKDLEAKFTKKEIKQINTLLKQYKKDHKKKK